MTLKMSDHISKSALCVFHQRCLHLHPKGLQPFVWSAIFLFRTRSLNKILCHLWPLWFYPVFFFLPPPRLSFPSRLYLPGGWFSCSPTFSLVGFFSIPGKDGKYFLLFTLMSFLLFVSLVSPKHDGPSYLYLMCVCKTVFFTVCHLCAV